MQSLKNGFYSFFNEVEKNYQELDKKNFEIEKSFEIIESLILSLNLLLENISQEEVKNNVNKVKNDEQALEDFLN